MADKTGPKARTDEPLSHASYSVSGQSIVAPELASGLYIVSTPIGNLRDVTIRALETLAAADLILCEDTRLSRRLLDAYAIATKTAPYNDHNGPKVRPSILDRLSQGATIALVSDAGTPLLSDPGYRLVAEAGERDLPVIPIPGASALLSGLVVSGLPTDQIHFAGFLPTKAEARARRLQILADIPATLVFYEAPQRVAATLAALHDALGNRDAVIARELTKRFESVERAALSDLAARMDAGNIPAKGEFVLLVGPPGKPVAPTADQIDDALSSALETLSVRDAAAEVAHAFGLPRREVYTRALALSDREDD
ncbi:MAG: 16S rRNA (cytidine(1402)-2'-O)-methyltransferase [Pseudomonadota bacterium]